MGTASVYSTGPYECVHRETTVGAWDSTSGRVVSRGEEMLSYQLRSVYLSHYMTYRRVFLHREQAFEQINYGISTVLNARNCVFTMNWDEETMKLPNFEFENTSICIDTIFSDNKSTYVRQMESSKFYSMLLKNKAVFQLLSSKEYRHRFVQKVSHSDKHWGTGMYRVGGFVTVSCKSDDEVPTWKDIVARIEFIIETSRVNQVTGEVIEVIDWSIGLRYLKSAGGKLTESELKRRKQTEIFERLVYGSSPSKSGGRGALWDIESITAINGDAFVIIIDKSNVFYVRRQFFDRSGWESQNNISPPAVDDTDEELRVGIVAQNDIENFFSKNKDDEGDTDDDGNESELEESEL